MTKTHPLARTGLAILVMVSSCSDQDSAPDLVTIPGPPSTPTPSPTPSPTSTPAPVPTYGLFPIQKQAQFPAIVAHISYQGRIGEPNVQLGTAATTRSSMTNFEISSGLGNRIWIVRHDSEAAPFNSADLRSRPSGGAGEYQFRFENKDGYRISQLDFLENIEIQRISSDPAASPTSVSYYHWWREASDASTGRIDSGVFGYPTQAGDIPSSGVRTYSGWVRGYVIRELNREGLVNPIEGMATITLDYSSRTLTATFGMQTVLPPLVSEGARVNFGSFTGASQNLFLRVR